MSQLSQGNRRSLYAIFLAWLSQASTEETDQLDELLDKHPDHAALHAVWLISNNFYRAPEEYRYDEKAFGLWAAERIREAIEFEGPDTVAAVFLEPVQNSGGCFPPPPGYLERVREICDEYDVLLVSDETICAFGRIGSMFACDDLGYQPDIITTAKGLTSAYLPLGACIFSSRIWKVIAEPGKAFKLADLVLLLTKGGNDTMTISYHLIRIANEQNKTSEGAAISYLMLFMVIVLTNLYLYIANRRSQGA